MSGRLGGRPQHKSWSNFILQKDSITGKRQTLCLVCNKTLKNTAESRLKAHRNICKPETTSSTTVEALVEIESPLISDNQNIEAYSSAQNIQIATEDNPKSDADDPEFDIHLMATCSSFTGEKRSISPTQRLSGELSHVSSSHTSHTSKKKQQLTLDSFTDIISNTEREILNEGLAQFIFGCNIPFSIVESTHFKNFIRRLRPAYKVPSRKYLSNRLLDQMHSKMQNEVKSSVQPNSVLLIDSWKNEASNTKNVATMLHNTEGLPAFLDAWDVTGERETAEKL